MTHTVIVTRTQPGADETAATLRAMGYAPLVSPMLSIVETGLDARELEGVSGIIFTSANGVRVFAAASHDPAAFTAWCVGPSTASAAREAGFRHVVEGDGDADDLARLILTARSEVAGPLLHIANDAAAGHLVASLRAEGMDARFAAAYQTLAAPSLSEAALSALAQGPVLVMLHSAKAAEAVARSGAALDQAQIVAISAAAAAPLQQAPCAGRWIAARPNEEALLTALGEAAAALRA